MRRRALGLTAFAAAAAGGAALGFLAERRVVRAAPPEDDPAWAELSAPPPVAHTEVEADDGTLLHAVHAGPEHAPVVVLVHGYAMSWRFWHYQLRDLADEFRVVAYDLRGHGDSEPAASGDYSTRTLARDLRSVLDALGGGRPALAAGHSLGGMTVMALADELPGYVERGLAGAALLNTAASKIIYRGLLHALSGGVRAMQRLPRRPGRLGRVTASDLAHVAIRQWSMTRDASPGLVAFVEELAAACPVDVLGGFGRVLATLDLEDALAQLTVPTLVVTGGRDWLTPARQGRELAAALPDGRLEEVPDVGHMPPLEAHGPTTALLREHARRCFGSREAGAA